MAVMSKSNHIQIFKTGSHTAMSGTALSFSDADLAATAAAYDPAKHEAPLVCGHPKHDDPAWGWVSALSFTDGGLEATPAQVNADFAELVAGGAFKKISASFYSPDSPNNPVPGVYYLRHVGFLGAQPPAVKGMRNPSFADNEQGVVEFSDWDDVQNASLWRRLRDWMIGKEGLDVADSILPDYTIASLEQAAREENDDQPAAATPQFTESQTKGDEMSVEDKVRLAALETENKTLKDQQAEFAESDRKRASDARHTEHASFAEDLVKAGKLLPAQKDVAVATLDFMASQEQVVEFGEGDARKPLADAFKELLQAAPKQVEFAEVGKDVDPGAANATVAMAPGYSVDPEKMATHLKALTYAEQNKCDYVTAVKAVGQV